MDRPLVREYVRLFEELNPQGPPVEVTYSGGWYQIKANSLFRSLRKTDLQRARDTLRRRAERSKGGGA